jgi:acyl-CoA thioester hydrolase
METMFSRVLRATWGDIDFNAHMRNTAYLEKAADVRLTFFEENGLSMADFERLRIGPVALRDEIDYLKEIRFNEDVTVSLELAGLSEDKARFRLRDVFTRRDGSPAAVVTSLCGWLDLNIRRLVPPPEGFLDVLIRLTRTEDYAIIPSIPKE